MLLGPMSVSADYLPLFQALKLSGEDAKVKGMRKVGSFLPFFSYSLFLNPLGAASEHGTD